MENHSSAIKAKPSKLSLKVWMGILIFGLFGQIAWIVENMYFNVFMDRTVTTNPFAVQLMVALSALFATAATLLAGTFSDKIGKRKVLISWGYIIWGLTVMVFAVISVSNTMKIFSLERGAATTATVAIIIIMDCIMSAVGATANDASFNAWVTDITKTSNRGRVEGVLAIMPLIAMAVVFGVLDPLTADTFLYANGKTGATYIEGATLVSHGNWQLFFLVLGAITSAVGVLGLFLVKDSKELKPSPKADFKDIFYGFRLAVIKENRELYLSYAAMAIIGIANMAYMPYLIMYVERTLGFADYLVPIAVIIGGSAISSVVLGIIFDKFGKQKFVFPLSILYIAGAVLLLLSSPIIFKNGTPMAVLMISGFIFMTANLGISAILTATVRDYTPKDKIGQFQGIRMFFWVLIPMVIGPLITAIITVGTKPVGKDYYGSDIYQYPPYMFAVTAAVMLINMPIILKIKKFISKPLKKF